MPRWSSVHAFARLALTAAVTLASAACGELESIDNSDPTQLDATELAKVRLGHDLFFDPGLSGAGDISCASCHHPAKYGTDGLARSNGAGGSTVRRNAPSVFNAALKDRQFWDGRAETLQAQARGPLFAPDEMAQTEDGLLAHVTTRWPHAFALAFPDQPGPTVEQVTLALAAYQQTLPRRSPFDRFLDGDRTAITPQARRGYRIFRRNCTHCHDGPAVGGTQYAKLGLQVPWPENRRQDLGRFEITGDPEDQMVFMTPSLRNVAETGPWFHDGSVDSLAEAVQLMARHQLDRTFTDQQQRALVAFLETLTAEDIPPWAYEDWTPEAPP